MNEKAISIESIELIDDLLRAERFQDVDNILKNTIILPARVVVAILAITRNIPKEKLPSRSVFFSNSLENLSKTLGKERANKVLENLR